MERKVKNISNFYIYKFLESSKSLLKLLFIYAIISIFLRLYEFFILHPFINAFLFTNEINGLFHDIFKISTLFLFFFPLYFLISFWSNKIAYFISIFFLFSFILISFFSIQYYVVSFIPLDQSFYTYSFDDLVKILFSSGDVHWSSYFTLFFLIVLFFLLQKYLVLKSNRFLYFIWIIWSLGLININKSHVKSKFFNKYQDYILVKNKGIYFVEQSARYFRKNMKNTVNTLTGNMINLAKSYAEIYPENKYLIPTYPVLRKRNDPDILSKYFNKSQSPPNIVFVILESMGRNICGPNARYGSFTPFLDSLIEKSLYWENCLSNADRTFGALPNILGSLPFGDRAFHDHKEKSFPHHKTIITDLATNDYWSGFYYGGWTHFDNMDDFLIDNKIDFILKDFDDDAIKIESDVKNFSWGYNDKSLFKQYLKVINSDSIVDRKRLDILLTISLHAPFMPPNKEYYLRKLDTLIQGFSDEKKKILNPYKNPLATVLYVDESLEYLMNEYKKREDYKNTIFIFVGDHNLHAMPDDNPLRQFHIPLIIFSPMLKEALKFSSVISHQDIYPSLISFLQKNYHFNLPKVTHSISNGLDDTKEFSINKSIPLFIGRNLNTSLINNGNWIIENNYYKVLSNINLKRINNDSIKNDLKHKLQVIKDINKYIYNEDKIIPRKYR